MNTPVAETRPTSPTGPTAALAGLGLIAVALAWSYRAALMNLVDQWSSDPNYSHGYFVVPIAAAIAWTRRDRLDPARVRPQPLAALPLLALLALRAWAYEENEQFLEWATIPPVVACVIALLGGLHALRVFWPAAFFLFLMLPLPSSLNSQLAGPLQRVATIGSVALLQTVGMPAVAEGNVIYIGSERLEVARACNGLSMLLSFVTLITAMVFLIRRPLWERAVLLLSTIPIALISNILRIAATAACYHFYGHEVGEKIAHDWAGYLMMPTALVLVLLEMKILSWLVVEVEAPPEVPGPALVAGRT